MDAKQAQQIAGRYRDLQGLRQAWVGVWLLLFFAWEMAFPLSREGVRAAGMGTLLWGLGSLVLGLGVAVIGVRWVSAWYRRRYGSVEPTARQRRLGMLIGGGGVLAFLIPFEIEQMAALSGQTIPVNLIDFTLALWIIGYWFYIGRSFRHHLVLAGVGFVLGFVSIAGIPPATFAWHLREATLYFAIATIVGGVIDHRILTSRLSQPEERIGIEP